MGHLVDLPPAARSGTPPATETHPRRPAANYPETGAAPRSRRKLGLGLIALALAAGAGTSWYLSRGGAPAEKSLSAAVERGDLEVAVSATGIVQPQEYVDVGTQVTGQLKSLHVSIGDTVKAGDLLAEIDPTLFQSRADTTRATLQNLEAQLIDRQAQLRLAEQRRARDRQLRRLDAVSEEALQQSEAAATQAQAQVDAVRAQIRQTQSALAGDAATLRYTRIFAPISGTVVAVNARKGQTLVASQQAPVILRIADLKTMTVWAQVSEADVPRIAPGMPAYFNTLGLPERRWQGKVRQLLPTPEAVNNVVLYNVLFDVANPDGVLMPQMSAQVYFQLARAENTLIVPAAALQPVAKANRASHGGKAENGERQKHSPASASREKTYTVRVSHDGQIEERAIHVGLQTRMAAQVLSGLAEGETVIVGPADGRTNGASAGVPAPGRRL